MQANATNVIAFLLSTTLLVFLLTIFIMAIIYFYKKKQKLYYANLQLIKSEFDTALLTTQLEIQEQTLQNISREIHDNIGLTLTMSKLNLNTLEKENAFNTEKISNSIELISKAIADLSSLSRLMNADYVTDNGLIKAIEIEMERIKSLKLWRTELKVGGEPVFMDGRKELVIFRIIQEALNNSMKYAKASTISLTLFYAFSELAIQIEDDGTGIPFEKLSKKSGSNGTGVGLINIHHRIEMVNGQCEITSGPGMGTIIKLKIPY